LILERWAEPGWRVLVYRRPETSRFFVSLALACDFSTPDVEYECREELPADSERWFDPPPQDLPRELMPTLTATQ
jgi:hypothetical protein